MEKIYDAKLHEDSIYKLWEKSGAFEPVVDKRVKPFCIIMPPPNASDPLHIGHARFVAIEDILIRYHRMKGDVTLWLPGADHAGFETQFVFEKNLAKFRKSLEKIGTEHSQTAFDDINKIMLNLSIDYLQRKET